MAADVTTSMVLMNHIIGDGGGIAIIAYGTATPDATDYIDMDTVLGKDVNVVFATGIRDYAGTAAADPMIWTGSSTTPDRVTIGTGADNKTRAILVAYQARKSTGGSA